MWVSFNMLHRLIKYNLVLVTQVVKTCKIHRFPGTGGVHFKKKSSNICNNYNRPSSSSSPILLLSDRKRYQVSVPSNLQEQDLDEDEDLNSLLGSNLTLANTACVSTRSRKKSSSSPTILVTCRCDSPVEQSNSSSLLSYDIGFPTPEEVRSNDPVFHVVAVDVHDSSGVNDEDEINRGFAAEKVKDGISIEDEDDTVFTVNSKSDLICNEVSASSAMGMQDLGHAINNVHPLKLASCKSLISVDDLESSTRSKPLKEAKVVGYFEGPDFASMKYTVSGKVWLWKRSEDILLIKDDGRIIDPSGMKRCRCHKSYHNQVKSSIGKLYDLIFSKKDKEKESRIAEKWATSSLDRHLSKPNTSKHGLQASLSTTDVVRCDRNNS